MLAPWKESYDQPRQHVEEQRQHFADKGLYVKTMIFPVVMYRCESWTIRKAEHQRIGAFELWCWRRLLRGLWTARRSNQSILKEISPGCSLEWLLLLGPHHFWKRSVFIPIPRKGNAKECSNYHTIALISHTSKVMLKISKACFNSTWTQNFQMFKLVLEKVEEPEIKFPTSVVSSKKQERSRKNKSISTLLTMPKPLTVWITINCGKFWKRWENQTTLPTSWEICMHVKKLYLELVMEQ